VRFATTRGKREGADLDRKKIEAANSSLSRKRRRFFPLQPKRKKMTALSPFPRKRWKGKNPPSPEF